MDLWLWGILEIARLTMKKSGLRIDIKNCIMPAIIQSYSSLWSMKFLSPSNEKNYSGLKFGWWYLFNHIQIKHFYGLWCIAQFENTSFEFPKSAHIISVDPYQMSQNCLLFIKIPLWSKLLIFHRTCKTNQSCHLDYNSVNTCELKQLEQCRLKQHIHRCGLFGLARSCKIFSLDQN